VDVSWPADGHFDAPYSRKALPRVSSWRIFTRHPTYVVTFVAMSLTCVRWPRRYRNYLIDFDCGGRMDESAVSPGLPGTATGLPGTATGRLGERGWNWKVWRGYRNGTATCVCQLSQARLFHAQNDKTQTRGRVECVTSD
jgi:hypothetical protein